MKDTYGRKIEYMRISLTEKCNLRCRYCMPTEGVDAKKHEDMLTEEELLTICKVAAKNGVKKFRLTGGEPLVKKNFLDICRKIKQIDGVEELCITTNGSLLSQYSKELKEIGETQNYARLCGLADAYQRAADFVKQKAEN